MTLVTDAIIAVQLMLGPNWIHGTFLNPLIPLAKASGSSLTFPDDAPIAIYASSGKRLSPQTSVLIYDRIWRFSTEAIAYSATDGAIPPEASVGDFCLDRIDEDRDLTVKAKAIARQLLSLLSDFTGTDARHQSLRHYKVEATLAVIVP